MSDKILRKVRFEVELLVAVAIFSVVVCLHLIADAAVALGVEQYGLALTTVRICEFVFAVIWLSFSLRFIFEINRLRRKHSYVYVVDNEQKKTKAAELMMDMVAFYRGSYVNVKAVMALAIAVSFLIIGAVAYLWIYSHMSFWEAVFRWILNSSMLLVASVLYFFVHRSWGRKLLKVKDSEKRLSEMLGGPIEA